MDEKRVYKIAFYCAVATIILSVLIMSYGIYEIVTFDLQEVIDNPEAIEDLSKPNTFEIILSIIGSLIYLGVLSGLLKLGKTHSKKYFVGTIYITIAFTLISIILGGLILGGLIGQAEPSSSSGIEDSVAGWMEERVPTGGLLTSLEGGILIAILVVVIIAAFTFIVIFLQGLIDMGTKKGVPHAKWAGYMFSISILLPLLRPVAIGFLAAMFLNLSKGNVSPNVLGKPPVAPSNNASTIKVHEPHAP